MDALDLRQITVMDPQVAEHLAAGTHDQAVQQAADRLAISLSDLGLALLAQGKVNEGIEKLMAAQNASPGNQTAFHNLAASLNVRRMLRGSNLESLARFVAGYHKRIPWLEGYLGLLFAPSFLNVEFVAGKCNLKCRMCIGTNGPNHPDKLSCLSADDFDVMLNAAPTITGVTLSAGDSDPLLHPEIERIIDIAGEHNIVLDFFTNGHPLSARLARKMVDSGSVNFLHFSIDAATPETYRRIRGASLDRVISKMEMLQSIKQEKGSTKPAVGMSFVAMEDNIEELPAFVELATRLGARRVFAEHLDGWSQPGSDNRPPTGNPCYYESATEAKRLADAAGIAIVLPEQLLTPPDAPAEAAEDAVDPLKRHTPETLLTLSPQRPEKPAETKPAAPKTQHSCCSWLRGVLVCQDGRLDPCCMVHRVADMGSIHDGPLMENPKYVRIKRMLMAGRVFPKCLKANQCVYVQQELAAGRRPPLITDDDLGELAPRVAWPAASDDKGEADRFDPAAAQDAEAAVPLPVLNG